MRVCSVSGCPTIYDGTTSRCPTHTAQADKARGTATQRGYTGRGHQAFRRAVLQRDPICVLCHQRQSTVADHHPTSRRDLLEQGLNPNDPQYGRALCATCHNKATATHQPGGWHG
jgi:5-methylcytosine-specific restriction protein A